MASYPTKVQTYEKYQYYQLYLFSTSYGSKSISMKGLSISHGASFWICEFSRSEIRTDDVICEMVLEPWQFFLKKVLGWTGARTRASWVAGHYTYHYTKGSSLKICPKITHFIINWQKFANFCKLLQNILNQLLFSTIK